jgi:hypothetical protein
MAIDRGVKSISISESGAYQVGSGSSCQEQTKSNPFVVTKSQPSVGNIKGGTEFCAGSSLTLTTEATGGVGSYKYEWLRNGEKVAEGSSYTLNTPGNYRTRVTDGIGCTAQFPTEVPIKENPRPSASLPMLTNLTGTETQVVKATVASGTAPYSYNWSADPNVNLNSTGESATLGPFTQNTQIKLRVTDAKGCQSEEVRTPLVYIPCTLSAGIQTQSFFFCKGSLPLVSTVQNGNDGYTYQWRKDNAPVGGSTATLDATEGGQYSVIITDKKGCRSASGTVNVTKGNPSVQITGRLEFCAGGSTLLKTTTQNARSPINYKWQGGSTTDSLRVASAGSYTLEITDAQGCTATAAAVAVAQLPLPVANAGMGKNVTCAETYALEGVGTASGGAGGYQYRWSAQPTVAINNPTAATPTLGPFKETTKVNLQITDAKGCVGTAQSTVTYIPPDLNVTLTGPAEFCSGKSVLLKTTVEKANLPLKQLVWYNGTQEIKRDINEWTTTQKGDYTVYVEDSKGCQKTSTVLKVAENPTPTVNIAGPTFFCYGNNATLTANVQSGTPPLKYQWQLNNAPTGSDNNRLTTTTEGSYKVSVNDAKGCAAEAAAWSLAEKGAELVAIVQAQGPTTVFAPQTVWLSAAAGKEYLYQWKRNGQNIANATGVTYEAKESGSYAVAVSRGECSRESAATTIRIDIPLSVASAITESIAVFPNPTTQAITVRTRQPILPRSTVGVYDLKGRLLHQQPLKEEVTFDISNYVAGTYLLKITQQNAQQSILVVKQ